MLYFTNFVNYNIVGRLAMIFPNEFNFKQPFDKVSSGENMYDEQNWVT